MANCEAWNREAEARDGTFLPDIEAMEMTLMPLVDLGMQHRLGAQSNLPSLCASPPVDQCWANQVEREDEADGRFRDAL